MDQSGNIQIKAGVQTKEFRFKFRRQGKISLQVWLNFKRNPSTLE